MKWTRWVVPITYMSMVCCSSSSKGDPEKAADPNPRLSAPFRIRAVLHKGGLIPEYVIPYGAEEGAHEGQVVFVYKADVLETSIRLRSVRDHSSLGILVGKAENLPEVNDGVYLRDLSQPMLGSVAGVDTERGLVLLALRPDDGALAGMNLRLCRNDSDIGKLRILQVSKFFTWAMPEAGTDIAEIKIGDAVKPADSTK